MPKIYILGAGGQAREIYQVYKDNKLANKVGGFIVTVPIEKKMLLGKRIFDSRILRRLTKRDLLMCAIGNSYKRKKMVEELDKFGLKYDTVVHNSVIQGDRISFGEGTVVGIGSVLTCDIKIGRHVLVNIGCTISHDVGLGDFVTLAPGVSIGGRIQIGEGTWIGIGATVLQDIKIGRNCFIGAGAVVVDDIPDNTLAYGIPAKPIKTINAKDWEKLI